MTDTLVRDAPVKRSELGLPPEPWLVRWYFEHRLLANYETGYGDAQIAANDRLWRYICEHHAAPDSGWLANNNASPNHLEPVQPAATGAEPVQPTANPRSSRADYWRDHKRRQRAAKRTRMSTPLSRPSMDSFAPPAPAARRPGAVITDPLPPPNRLQRLAASLRRAR